MKHPVPLTKECCERILEILDRKGATTVRDFWRSYDISLTALAEAMKAGVVTIRSRKPPTGRPSLVVFRAEPVNNSIPAKPLPSLQEVPPTLSIRHRRFVHHLATAEPLVDSYYGAGFQPTSHAAARAAASRLAKRPFIQAALHYLRLTMRFFVNYPTDLRIQDGIPWRTLLQRFPMEPHPMLVFSLACARSYPEARALMETAAERIQSSPLVLPEPEQTEFPLETLYSSQFRPMP